MTGARRAGAALLAVFLLAVGDVVRAYETRGARPCLGWQQFRLDERAGSPLSAQIYETWLVGYLSGLIANSGVDFLAGTANDTVFAMVDGYCGVNAGMNLASAGDFVARTLVEQKGIAAQPNWP